MSSRILEAKDTRTKTPSLMNIDNGWGRLYGSEVNKDWTRKYNDKQHAQKDKKKVWLSLENKDKL